MAFEAGVPVSIDGLTLGPVTLLQRIAQVAGRHGFGRVDMIENRLVGIKSRELYEVPGALALIAAHRDLEALTLEREVAHEKAGLERRWAELAYYGQWHGPLHASLRTFMHSTQDSVSGEVRLRFHKGTCTVVGRRSERALYDPGWPPTRPAPTGSITSTLKGFVAPLGPAIAHDLGRRERSSPFGGCRSGARHGRRPPRSGFRGGGAIGDPARPLSCGRQRKRQPPVGRRFAGGGPSEGTLAFTRSLSFDKG